MYEITKLPSSIDIGFTGEHQFRVVEIDMRKWMRQMPNGVPSIVHIRPNETIDDAYIASTTFENGILRWPITRYDLGGAEGVGTMQVWLEDSENNTLNKRGKSALAATQVYGAINDPNELSPTPRSLLMKLVADIITLPSGSDASVSLSHDGYGTYTLHFKIPRGEKGDEGKQGNAAPVSAVAPAVAAWMDANIHEDPTVVVDNSLSIRGAAADAKATGDFLIYCKGRIPETFNEEDGNADLDITDTNGNVILRLAGGHILTKNFNSAQGSPFSVEPTNKSTDLDFTDVGGNVILRLKDGHIFTKNFRSDQTQSMRGLKWTCIGDSLTAVNSRATKRYYDYIEEETGITVVNMGKSGSGYKKQYENSNAFYQRITSVPTDSDIVTIFGSGNDLTSNYSLGDVTDTGTTTICGCINTTIDNLYSVMPVVRLGIITPTPWQHSVPSDPTCAMSLYSEALVEICKRRGIPCLDLYHCSNLRPDDATFRSLCYSRDDGEGTHPDENGHKIIAPMFREFIKSLI